MPDDEYMMFCCNDIEHPCNFKIQAKTKEEVAEHAKAHLASEHGLKGRDIAKKVEDAIKPVKV